MKGNEEKERRVGVGESEGRKRRREDTMRRDLIITGLHSTQGIIDY